MSLNTRLFITHDVVKFNLHPFIDLTELAITWVMTGENRPSSLVDTSLIAEYHEIVNFSP